MVLVRELRVMLFPTDFAKTRQFYEQLMGWPIQHEWDSESNKGVMFATGSGTIELLWTSEMQASPGNTRLSLRVNDVWALWTRLCDETNVVHPLRENPWGDDSFCIADPDGVNLTFFTDRKDRTA